MLTKNLLPFLAALAPAFAQEEEGSETPDLTSLVSSDDRLSTLGQILEQYPDVASTLANATNVTVLAPTNDAFQTFLEGAGLELSDVTEDMVAAILNYHVLNGTYSSENITDSPTFLNTLLMNEEYSTVTDGQVISVQSEDDNVIFTSGYKTEATVEEADLEFSGGIAHIIDSVNVIPPNVTALASAANLTAFLGALEAAELTETVGGLTDVTILAPSNEAFEQIGSAVGNLSTEELATILQYHVINGTIAYSPSIGNGSVPSLGGDLNLTVSDGSIFVNQARVVNADNLISNGVLHVINGVLNPNGTVEANPEEEDAEPAFENATTISNLAALTSGLPSATTTASALVTTTDRVAEGYTTVTEGPVGSGAGGEGAEETSEEAAPMVTGAVGMAALFGGAALMANF